MSHAPRTAGWMQRAIAEARRALGHRRRACRGGGGRCGRPVIGTGRNERELRHDPTAHAEVVAMREAAAARGDWQLEGCTLVVTLEPCVMCAGAILAARVPVVVFGAWDEKAGASGRSTTCSATAAAPPRRGVRRCRGGRAAPHCSPTSSRTKRPPPLGGARPSSYSPKSLRDASCIAALWRAFSARSASASMPSAINSLSLHPPTVRASRP